MQLNIPKINPSQFYQHLTTLAQMNEAVIVYGPPGSGKSSTIKQWAKDHNYSITVRMLAQVQPSDLSIPYIDKGVLRWAVSDWLYELPKTPHILFLDEFDKISPDVRCAILQLLLDRELGNFKLPDATMIVCAANRPDDMTGGYNIDPATADRLCHLEVKVDPGQWINWAIANNVHPYVLAFLKQNPHLLEDETNQLDLCRRSPRSWVKVSDYLRISKLEPKELMPIIAGRIGNNTTTDFVTFLLTCAELKEMSFYLKANNAEIERYAPTNIGACFALAYGLNAIVNTTAQYVKAMKVIKTVCDVNKNSFKTADLLVSSLSLILTNVINKGTNKFLEIMDEKDFKSDILPLITSIPDLNSLVNSK